ncbi:RAxF-45 family protein [Bacillus sp. EB01]|nr:RAxF-45 family protein [Bacillus sp. EB01]
MNRSVGLHGQFLEFIYICRAIFHEIAFNGIRMPFFAIELNTDR